MTDAELQDQELDDEPVAICPFHSWNCGDTTFGGCILEEIPSLDDCGYICPRSDDCPVERGFDAPAWCQAEDQCGDWTCDFGVADCWRKWAAKEAAKDKG